MAYNTIADLDSLISTLNTLSNQARQSENQRYSRDTSVFNDFNEQIAKSMTNDNLATIEGRVDRYINDYGHRMSDLGAENFTILKERIKNQREDNTKYEMVTSQLYDVSDKNTDLLELYANSDNMEAISWTEGEGENQIQYSYNPEDENYQEGKRNYKKYLANEVKKGFEEYMPLYETLGKDYANRISSDSQRNVASKLKNNVELFQFGLDSIDDDNIMSKSELRAYGSALMTGNMGYINEYRTREEQFRTTVRGQAGEEYKNITNFVNEKQDLINKWNAYTDLEDSEDQEVLKNQPFFPDPQNEDVILTYEEFGKDLRFKDLINDYSRQIGESKLKLKDINERFITASMGEGDLSEAFPIYDSYKKREIVPSPPAPNIESEVLTEDEIKEKKESNTQARAYNRKTSGNIIEIDYSDMQNVQTVGNVTYIKNPEMEKTIKLKSSQLEEYQNPTVTDYNSFVQALMSKENRPDYKEGFPEGSDIETFLSVYNPKLKSKLKPLLHKMWSQMERGLNPDANKTGEQILKTIKNTKVNYPKIDKK